MAYYFMSEDKRGQYVPIKISNSKYFPYPEQANKKTFSYKLPEIDLFTMMFDNEIELRERLVEEGILPIKTFEKPLSIRCLYDGKYDKVPYDFLYQKDIEYIMEPTRLIEKIVTRFYDMDFLLIQKILSRFKEDYNCKSTLPEVRSHLEASVRERQINRHFYDLDENQDLLLNRLLKLIIFESYNTRSGKTIYRDKVRYRNLHILIALVNYYDKEELKIDSQDNNINLQEAPKQEEKEQTEEQKQPVREYEFVRPKTRTRKKYDLDGQTGFDI